MGAISILALVSNRQFVLVHFETCSRPNPSHSNLQNLLKHHNGHSPQYTPSFAKKQSRSISSFSTVLTKFCYSKLNLPILDALINKIPSLHKFWVLRNWYLHEAKRQSILTFEAKRSESKDPGESLIFPHKYFLIIIRTVYFPVSLQIFERSEIKPVCKFEAKQSEKILC